MSSKLEKQEISTSRCRRFAVGSVAILLILLFFTVLCELFVRFCRPQEYMYPRYKYSVDYGAALFENTKMIHTMPGRYRYIYTINEYGYRGQCLPISNSYKRKNLVVLGDSYSFGQGVNDGEEYPAILQRALDPEYNVINLGCPGNGLTQEIRKFYEFGRLYDPKIVLLQFCDNDPSDNLFNKVTEVKEGVFTFKKTNNRLAWIKRYLSYSLLQKSQLYNFFRNRIYTSAWRNEVARTQSAMAGANLGSGNGSASAAQQYYNELLVTFARDLKQRGIRFQLISVNGHLNKFPLIRQQVDKLNAEGLCEYIDVVPWFTGITHFASPEGHEWGAKADAIVGTNLAAIIRGTR